MSRSICFVAAFPWMACVLCDGGSAVVADSPKPRLEQEVLFQNGDLNYANYRIPSLVVTSRGTILALCEGRKNTGSD